MQRTLLTALNYSAGTQSEWLAWMVLLGLIEIPKQFIVVCADPGMENSGSYSHAAEMRTRFREKGIEFIDAEGPDLYQDILTLKDSGRTRFDQPPYWTETDHAKEGKLPQRCTRFYKVAPMDREIRKALWRRRGIPADNAAWLGEGIVERWIGFTADELDRRDGMLAAPMARFQKLRFPLIELGLTKSDVVAEYAKHGLKLPPRSLCNACPFHGLRSLKEMHDNRPGDWQQAVNVDEAIRDWKQIGVNHRIYVSKTLLPLVTLAEMDFKLADPVKNDLQQCSSGVCFL